MIENQTDLIHEGFFKARMHMVGQIDNLLDENFQLNEKTKTFLDQLYGLTHHFKKNSYFIVHDGGISVTGHHNMSYLSNPWILEDLSDYRNGTLRKILMDCREALFAIDPHMGVYSTSYSNELADALKSENEYIPASLAIPSIDHHFPAPWAKIKSLTEFADALAIFDNSPETIPDKMAADVLDLVQSKEFCQAVKIPGVYQSSWDSAVNDVSRVLNVTAIRWTLVNRDNRDSKAARMVYDAIKAMGFDLN